MKNFKEIAEKCLAGELSGRFVCRDGLHISSFTLSRTDNPSYPYKLYRVGKLTKDGLTPNKWFQNEIIQFIPYEEMKQEQIKIDIPEGKVPVMEQTENGVVITWKEKEVTYDDIWESIDPKLRILPFATPDSNKVNDTFFDKVNVLRKLTNIRNYFGKPKHFCDGVVIKCVNSYCGVETGQFYFDKPDLDNPNEVVFAKREHAEQAIKMLGDELKYLFEPW